MSIFDVIGPVMVGPSSSHTAGAVRIGYISRKLIGENIVKADIRLYGSFLATGKGHGTRKAVVAGLLGMKPDDMRIPDSLDIASSQGMYDAMKNADSGYDGNLRSASGLAAGIEAEIICFL